MELPRSPDILFTMGPVHSPPVQSALGNSTPAGLATAAYPESEQEMNGTESTGAENDETRRRQRGSVSATSTRQRSIAEAVSGAAALVRGGRGSRARRSRRAPPSCLPQDKCGLIFHGLSAHVLCLSHRGVGDVSPKTSLVRLCLRLFSSHKVHRAHSRAPAVCKSQPLCQCCCATPSAASLAQCQTEQAEPELLHCIVRKGIKRCRR